ncbi:MAG TPA: Maf family nucleotide pyrophosphatase [Mycobacterium sp.]|nr:Maf family nucleotide pyrophosphatase [Mycobacterium sp.]
MTRVVLASASSGRRKVLRGAGIDPHVIVSGVDEEAIEAAQAEDAGPGHVTTALAAAKARAVAPLLDSAVASDCVVIGCDSMLFRDGRLWGKPTSAAAAIEGWQAMAGRTAQLYTGHSVIRLRHNEIVAEAADYAVTTVRFGSPSSDDLAAYARSGEPVAVAGGFTLDGLGGWFIEGIDGDPSAVIGIGLPLILRLFNQVGLSIAELWRANPA